jgi:signal transduction histidine kinase
VFGLEADSICTTERAAMHEDAAETATGERRNVLLSTMPAANREQRLALAVIVVLTVAFALTAPFASVQLAPVEAFIPAYEAALLVNDLITAVLLFAQFTVVRSRALLVLAFGYLFTALIVIPHALTFPGLFAPAGLLGAGPQSTAWLYMFWHAGFPLAVIYYSLCKCDGTETGRVKGAVSAAILSGVAVVVAVVCALTLLATAGHFALPAIMRGHNYTPTMIVVVSSVWGLSLAALVLLWRRQPYVVIDLWLMVVMCAWLFDVALSAVLNAGRFDLGFYAGRICGLMAASFVLLVLLSEATTLYARLVRSIAAERRERDRRFNEMQAVLAHLARVSEMGQIVSSLTHEVNQPLTAVGSYLYVIQRLAEKGSPEMIGPAVQRAVEQADRATAIISRLRDFIAKRETDKQAEDLRKTIDGAVSLALVGMDSAGLSIEKNLDSRAAIAFMDRIQIEQVLFNLVRNAVEAMAGGARRSITIATTRAGPHTVQVSIADTGPGLPERVRAKLFEPFVTTKASGMGVGLSICRVIVESHGGTLQVADNPGGGTVFRFTLSTGKREAIDRRAG